MDKMDDKIINNDNLDSETFCTYKINETTIKLKYINIIEMIEKEKKKNVQTKMFLVPFYVHDKSLCTVLFKYYNTDEFIQEGHQQGIVCGNNNDVENKKIAGIVNLDGIKICLFSYFSLWPHTKSFTSGNLEDLFKSISNILDNNINEIIIPPFGINNKKSYKESAYILFTNIKKCVENNIFNNIKKIKFIGLNNNNNDDVFTHLNNIIKIHMKNKNICIICCDTPVTHYFFGCKHAGYCLKCITNCTFSFMSIYMCPYCKQKSSIQEIPLNVVELCTHDNKNNYVLECNCILFMSCDDCIHNNANKCCSFNINTAKKFYFP